MNAPASNCHLTIVRDGDGLVQLRTAWDGLFAASPSASPPLRYAWVAAWWRIYGPVYGNSGGGLRIFCIWRGDELIGLLPLYLQTSGRWFETRILRFISTGAAEFEETSTEYLDLLHRPGEAAACVELIAAELLAQKKVAWDQLLLEDMDADSPLCELSRRLQGGGRVINSASPGPCFISDLSGGMEAYLKMIGSSTRGKCRKMLRDMQSGAVQYQCARDANEAMALFDDLVRLHRARWNNVGKSGSFAPRHEQFHRLLVRDMVADGGAIICRLSVQGQVVAAMFGYRVGNKFDVYQLGIDRDCTLIHSAGTALFLGTLTELMNRGVTQCDQLRGVNRFKQDFCKTLRPLTRLTITRPTLRMAMHQARDLARRALVKARKRLNPPAKASDGMGTQSASAVHTGGISRANV